MRESLVDRVRPCLTDRFNIATNALYRCTRAEAECHTGEHQRGQNFAGHEVSPYLPLWIIACDPSPERRLNHHAIGRNFRTIERRCRDDLTAPRGVENPFEEGPLGALFTIDIRLACRSARRRFAP